MKSVGAWFNCLFGVVAIPLGFFLVGDGIYLAATGKADYGVFLLILGTFLLAGFASGIVTSRRKQRRSREAARGRSRKAK